jgi:hypothetical protein
MSDSEAMGKPSSVEEKPSAEASQGDEDPA